MTFISFSDPIVQFQLLCTVGATVGMLGFIAWSWRARPAGTNLAIAACFGMWSLLCLFESLVAIRWFWETGFYLLAIVSFYFGYRALHLFLLRRRPAWETRIGRKRAMLA